MLNRFITFVTLVSFISYLCGCSSIEVVDLSTNPIDEYKDSKITAIITHDNKIYEFDTKGVKARPQIIDSLLIGWAIGIKYEHDYTLREFKIPVAEIKTLYIEEVDVVKGSLSIIGIAAGFVGILILNWGITTDFEFDLD
jgi:hypothetical protein